MNVREVVIPRSAESGGRASAVTATIQLSESVRRQEADRAQLREVVARYGVSFQVVDLFFRNGLDSLDDICWAFASEDEIADWVIRAPTDGEDRALQAARCRAMWHVLRHLARGGPGRGVGSELARRIEATEAADAIAEGVDRAAIRRARLDFWLRWKLGLAEQGQPSDAMLMRMIEEVNARELSVFDMEEVVSLEQQRLRASRSTRFNARGEARTERGELMTYWSTDPVGAYLQKLDVYLLALVIAGSKLSDRDRQRAEQGEQLTGAEVSMEAVRCYFMRAVSYAEEAPEGTGRELLTSEMRQVDRALRQEIAMRVGYSDRRIGVVIKEVIREKGHYWYASSRQRPAELSNERQIAYYVDDAPATPTIWSRQGGSPVSDYSYQPEMQPPAFSERELEANGRVSSMQNPARPHSGIPEAVRVPEFRIPEAFRTPPRPRRANSTRRGKRKAMLAAAVRQAALFSPKSQRMSMSQKKKLRIWKLKKLLSKGVEMKRAAKARSLGRVGSVMEVAPRSSACKYKLVGSAGQKFCKDFNKGRCWRAPKKASRCSEGLHRCARVLSIGKVCCAAKHGAVDCPAVTNVAIAAIV